jgi:hypothetical protein
MEANVNSFKRPNRPVCLLFLVGFLLLILPVFSKTAVCASPERPAEPSDSASLSADTSDSLERILDRIRQPGRETTPAGSARDNFSLQQMNPDISVIIDTFYHHDGGHEPVSHILDEMDGFGHSHSHGDEHGQGHAHTGLEEGFNLRHLELHLSAEVDPYFRGWAVAAVSEHNAEIEEAVIQTIALPGGLQLQGGKFFSNFGRINAIHAHAWDFVDRPLIFELTLGDHGLNDKGIQASWLAPLVRMHLLAGIEAFQGENETSFRHIGHGPLPDKNGPRLYVGWLKFGPELPDAHGLQFGFSGATGVHQEAHDGSGDGLHDHWLDGDSRFYGFDLVYKYDDARAYGRGDWIFQGEYLYRKKKLDLVRHDLRPDLVGNKRIDEQDGYYVQAVYGIWPRWRAGLRMDQVGLTNKAGFPNGNRLSYDDSSRISGMIDFSPSEFSRLRLQFSNGRYAADDHKEDAWQVFFQCVISLGTHGAHTF